MPVFLLSAGCLDELLEWLKSNMLPQNTTIARIVDETPSIRTLFLDIAFPLRPGQFVMVWVRGVDEIPMALSYPNGITVQRVGDATQALFEMEVGDSLGIRGPYGNGFTLQGGRLLVIAGGVGAAPLAPLAETAHSQGLEVTTLLGARNRKELLFKDRFTRAGELRIATDDGSQGYHGSVIDLACPEGYTTIATCGPEGMMAALLQRLPPEMQNKAQFSLHRYIKCGIGICGACCIDPSGLRVCRDGPVFTGDKLVKSELGRYRRDAAGRKIQLQK